METHIQRHEEKLSKSDASLKPKWFRRQGGGDRMAPSSFFFPFY